MKKLLIMLMVLFSALTANAKCDWSTLKLQQWNERNYYKWYVSGQVFDDTCVNYEMSIYNFQTGKSQILKGGKDTGVGFEYYLYEKYGLVEVLFTTKGRYKLYIKVWNRCEKCDTALYRPIEIVQFPGAGLGYSVDKTDCKKYKFEMSYIKGYPLKDTCMEYYMVFYKGPWMDTMSQTEWDNLTDYQIAMEYDFPDEDFLGYTQTRIADFTFEDTGRVLMYAQWWNSCLSQDTFMFRRLDVCKSTPTNGLKPITPSVGGMARPNPTSCEFYITETRTPAEYMILNTSGTVIAVGTTSVFEQVKVQTCNWPNGVYYLWVMGVGRELIMIQH